MKEYRMTFNRTTLSAAIISTLIPSLGHGQSLETFRLEEVIVTASRIEKLLVSIPNTATVINQKDLTEQIGINNDLSTILGNLVPSFSPSRQKMTGYGESLRGRSPLYMVDGVPQSNPLRDGSRDGHTIDPIMLERIEVIHGANAIHGVGASGGIINMITRQPTEEWQQRIKVNVLGQDEDFSESNGYGLSYSIAGSHDAIDLLASISYRSSGINYDGEGVIVGFDNAQGDTMDANTLNLFLKTGYSWDDEQQRLEITINDYDISGNNRWTSVRGDVDAGIPTTAERANFPEKDVSNEVSLYTANYTHQNLMGQKLHIKIYDQTFAATYGGGTYGTYQDPRIGEDIFDQSQNNSHKRGMKLTMVKNGILDAPLNLVYGIDYLSDETYQQLILTNRSWVPETEYENWSLFLQAEYTGVENLTLTAGARYEDSTLEVDDFTTLYRYAGGQFVSGGKPEITDTLKNVGATYQLGSQWRVYGSYAEGFSMPDVGRVLRGINVPGLDVDTFLDLEPVITDNIELGLEYNGAVVSAQLSYYSSSSDLGQRLQVDQDGVYSVKREKTEIEGLELRADWYVNQANTLGLRYALTEGEYDSDGDNSVDTDLGGANMSPDRLNLSWHADWTEKLNTRLQVNLLDDRDFKNINNETTTSFDGYTTIDFYGEIETQAGNFSVGLQNLTNRVYFTYYSQTIGSDRRNFRGIGRSISLSYALTF